MSVNAFTLTGTGVAMATPFTATSQVHFAALAQLTEHLIAGGVDYLVPLGSTGETATLSEAEAEAVLQAVLQTNAGRLPVLLGCGGNDTQAVVKRMEQLATYPVQGFLSVSPAYNKPSQEGIYQHYRALAAATALPLVLYNVPGRTASNILPGTVVRLAIDCPTIIGIKEASGNLEQGMKIIRDAPASFQVISGDDALCLPAIGCGYRGVISVVANALPKAMSQIVRLALAGNPQALAGHLRLLQFTELLFAEGNPTGIKAALALLGIGSGQVRLPLTPASSELTVALKQELAKLHALGINA